MSAKPTIVLYGNCAGQFLANRLRRIPSLTGTYDIHWIRNFSGAAPGDEPLDLSALPRCQVLFEQVGNFKKDMQRGGGGLDQVPLPEGARRIRFPPLFLNSLWPFIANDKRSDALCRPWMIEGPYPKYVCNRLLLDILKEEPDPDRAWERFAAIRLRDKVDLDRLHALTMAKIRGLDRDCDIPVGDFIDKNFTRQQLFFMQLHPAPALLQYLFAYAGHMLGLPDALLVEQVGQVEHGIGGYHAPIHPEIVEHFGLTWARGLTYRHYSEGWFTHEEYMKRNIRLEWNEPFYAAAHVAREGKLEEAETALAELVRRPGAPAAYFRQLAQVYQKLGKRTEALQALAAAEHAPRSDP